MMTLKLFVRKDMRLQKKIWCFEKTDIKDKRLKDVRNEEVKDKEN